MLSIVVGIITLIVLVYQRISVIIAAPAAITLVALLNGLAPTELLTGEYAAGVASFVEDFLFVFILGAMLGKIMTNSGAAQTIAYHIIHTLGTKRGLSAVLISSALLAYGGIPGFVLVFTIYPISLPVLKEANLPRHFIPALISGGVATVAIPMPGSPQVHNIIPMETFGTGALAGFSPGMAGVIVSFTLALLYLEFRAKMARASGQEFSSLGDESIVGIPPKDKTSSSNSDIQNPSLIKSLTPLIMVITTLSLLDVSVIVSLTLGVITGMILFYNYIGSVQAIIITINNGIKDSLTPLLFAGSAVGFGLALRSFPAFEGFLQSIIELSVDSLVVASLITNLGAAIMGSASGGIVLTMSFAGENFLSGADPEALHRIVTMSSAVLDTVPFNNGYLAILAFTGLSLKDTYLDFFMVSVLIPAVGLLTSLFLFI